ncbi:MAG: ABC transporter ATP-binding protein, partial [Alphaproteobacteria bacterium]
MAKAPKKTAAKKAKTKAKKVASKAVKTTPAANKPVVKKTAVKKATTKAKKAVAKTGAPKKAKQKKSSVKKDKKIKGYGGGGVDVVMSVDQVAKEAASIAANAPTHKELLKLAKNDPLLTINALRAGYG